MHSEGEGLLPADVWGRWEREQPRYPVILQVWRLRSRAGGNCLRSPREGSTDGHLPAGQAGGLMKHRGEWGPCAFMRSSLPVPAWGPGMFIAKQDVAGNHESRGGGVCEGINDVELTSGSKSLSLSFKLALTCPCLVESGGCPQRCLANRTPSQAMAVRPHSWLRMHRGSQNPRPSWTVAGMGAFLEHNSYERGISFAGSLSVRGSMALSRARQTSSVKSRVVNMLGFEGHTIPPANIATLLLQCKRGRTRHT